MRYPLTAKQLSRCAGHDAAGIFSRTPLQSKPRLGVLLIFIRKTLHYIKRGWAVCYTLARSLSIAASSDAAGGASFIWRMG